jgi:hypothetical protein
MAARTLRPRHQEDIRRKIQASVLIDFLTKHVKGEREMTPSQIRSAEILLKKSVPDLISTEMTADLTVQGEVGIRPQLTREEWLALHKGGK